MRFFPVSLLSHVRGLIRRAPSSRLYVVPALARTNPKISHSEQLNAEEGNFDCNALELNEIGVLRVLSSMRDDPYLALSFLKRIEGNGALPSVQAYATVIRIVCSWGLDKKLDPLITELIRKGDEERGFSVMDLLKAVGEAEENEKRLLLLLSRLSGVLVKAYANLEMFDDATDIFFQIYSLGCAPDIKALNFLMNRLIASGETDRVVGIFWELERLGLGADAHSYVLVVQALHRNNDQKGIDKVLSRLVSSETTPPCVCYLTFIEGLCLNQMVDMAYVLLQPLRNANFLVDISHLAVAYHKVICGLCNEMKIDKAIELLQEMVEKRIRINCVIVSLILRCFCQMGKFSEAYDRFKEFRDMNISLDRVCHNVAFDVLGKLGKVEEAIELFREMKGKGIVPDVINYTTLIGGCCLHGKTNDAFDLMTEMEESGKIPDIATYNVFAGGLARNGLAEEAIDTLKLMEARGVKPTSVTHNMVIEGLIVAGKISDAEAFYESLKHKSREIDGSIVKGYCEAGRLVKAFERFIKLEFPLPKNVYYTLFTSLCEKGYIGKAQELLDRMWKLGVEPGKSMYGKLIGAWCRVNYTRKARQVFKVMVAREIIPDLFTYTIMINTYCRFNKEKEACDLFKDMKRRGIKPDVVTFTVFLNHNPKLDLDMRREMIDLDVKPDVVYYTVMINTCLRSNEVKKARALFKDMKRREIKPDVVTYTVLLNNNPELDFKREMEDLVVKPDVFYYTVLINQQCKIGDLNKAKDIFVEMIDSKVKPDAAPFTALIACCFKIGYRREAKQIFDCMIEKRLKLDVVLYKTLEAGKAVTFLKELSEKKKRIAPSKASRSKAKRLQSLQ